MAVPRYIWILPNRHQTQAREAIENGQRIKLAKVIDLAHLPPELALGIPESLIARARRDDLIFSQFVRQPVEERGFLTVSTLCGTDKVNRTVTLTLLIIISAHDPPLKLLELLNLIDGASLPSLEKGVAARTLGRIMNRSDVYAKSVRQMLGAVIAHKSYVSFANVDIPKYPYSLDWTPKKKLSLLRFCFTVIVGVLFYILLRKLWQM